MNDPNTFHRTSTERRSRLFLAQRLAQIQVNFVRAYTKAHDKAPSEFTLNLFMNATLQSLLAAPAPRDFSEVGLPDDTRSLGSSAARELGVSRG